MRPISLGSTKTTRIALGALVLLVGCTQTMILFPRGGGPQVLGTLNAVGSTMSIGLDGETYTGDFMRSGRGSNNYSGLLVSKSGKTLRCEFVGDIGVTGNGVCQHGGGQTYDLLLNP
jgi:hypothetical protein